MVKSMVLRELHTLEETTMDKVRFLMSDTGAQITEACREALEQKGVEVTVVEKDGNKVLQKMLAVRPQVVLLDAFMPGLDALAVKQRYNAAGERHTSFFVTGAFQSEEMVQELLDEGFAYYFVKPFDETVLASRVLKVAAGQEKRILHTSVDSDELTEIKERLIPFMVSECGRHGVSRVYFMLTDIMEQSTELLFYGEGSEEMAVNAFKIEPKDGTIYLKGVVSRKKQLIPPLMEAAQMIGSDYV